jgi:hypothetical protein
MTARALISLLLLAACGPNADLRPVGEGDDTPLPADDTGPGELPPGAPVINEFLPYTANGLLDEVGEPTDWIELYNPGDEDLSLAGFALTPSFGDAQASPLDPALVLPTHGFLLLEANGHPEFGPDSLAFTLPIEGEVALFWRYTAIDLVRYDAQSFDVSAARSPDGGPTWTHDATPTPGLGNASQPSDE